MVWGVGKGRAWVAGGGAETLEWTGAGTRAGAAAAARADTTTCGVGLLESKDWCELDSR